MSIKPQVFLQHIPLFAACAETELVGLARSAVEVRFARGDVLFRQGEVCTGMHVLIVGVVKLALHRATGAEKVLEIVHAGQSFGDAVMFLAEPYPVTAEATEDGVAMFLPAQALFAALESDKQLARRMLAGLSMRLRSMVRDVEAYTLASGTERVVSYLINALGEQTRGSVTLPVNKQVLASRLSLSPETLSRILLKLSDQAGLQVEGRTIHIVDVNQLYKILNPA